MKTNAQISFSFLCVDTTWEESVDLASSELESTIEEDLENACPNATKHYKLRSGIFASKDGVTTKYVVDVVRTPKRKVPQRGKNLDLLANIHDDSDDMANNSGDSAESSMSMAGSMQQNTLIDSSVANVSIHSANNGGSLAEPITSMAVENDESIQRDTLIDSSVPNVSIQSTNNGGCLAEPSKLMAVENDASMQPKTQIEVPKSNVLSIDGNNSAEPKPSTSHDSDFVGTLAPISTSTLLDIQSNSLTEFFNLDEAAVADIAQEFLNNQQNGANNDQSASLNFGWPVKTEPTNWSQFPSPGIFFYLKVSFRYVISN